MYVFLIIFGGNFLFYVDSVSVLQLDLRNLMHSPLAIGLYVKMG